MLEPDEDPVSCGKSGRTRSCEMFLLRQPPKRTLDARVSVAHSKFDGERVAQSLRNFFRKRAAMNQERRAPLGPDLGVLGGAFLRATRQDDQVQQQPAQGGWEIDDVWIAQEFA